MRWSTLTTAHRIISDDDHDDDAAYSDEYVARTLAATAVAAAAAVTTTAYTKGKSVSLLSRDWQVRFPWSWVSRTSNDAAEAPNRKESNKKKGKRSPASSALATLRSC